MQRSAEGGSTAGWIAEVMVPRLDTQRNLLGVEPLMLLILLHPRSREYPLFSTNHGKAQERSADFPLILLLCLTIPNYIANVDEKDHRASEHSLAAR